MKLATDRSLQGPVLLIVLGLIWGSGYSLARYATTHGVSSMGYAFWQSLGPAVFTLCWCLLRKVKFPRDSQHLRYYLICGLLGIAFPNTNMYFAAPHLPAGLLAVVVNTVPVMTYVLAWLFREESLFSLRCVGVVSCFVGIMVLLLSGTSIAGHYTTRWVLQALLSPLSFAITAIYSTRVRPRQTSSLVLSSGMLIASTVFLVPIVLLSGQFYSLLPPWHMADGAVVLEMILSSLGYVVFFQLLKVSGPVYYSLVGGIVAITGLFWGWLLFAEYLSLWSSWAVVLIILGVLLVSKRSRRS